MSRPVERSVQARRDVLQHFVYIAQKDLDAAKRFLQSVKKATKRIADLPEIGSVRRIGSVEAMRMWPIPDFENYLIFYREAADSIQIVRVLHSSQDYYQVFSKD